MRLRRELQALNWIWADFFLVTSEDGFISRNPLRMRLFSKAQCSKAVLKWPPIHIQYFFIQAIFGGTG